MDIIFFDGVCTFCDASVQYIIAHDPQKKFRFAALQSEQAAALLAEQGIETASLKSIIFLTDGRIYQKSTAVVKIAHRLGWPARILMLFLLIPKPFRDMIYDLIAEHRYRIFGTRETCRTPNPEERERFIL